MFHCECGFVEIAFHSARTRRHPNIPMPIIFCLDIQIENANIRFEIATYRIDFEMLFNRRESTIGNRYISSHGMNGIPSNIFLSYSSSSCILHFAWNGESTTDLPMHHTEMQSFRSGGGPPARCYCIKRLWFWHITTRISLYRIFVLGCGEGSIMDMQDYWAKWQSGIRAECSLVKSKVSDACCGTVAAVFLALFARYSHSATAKHSSQKYHSEIERDLIALCSRPQSAHLPKIRATKSMESNKYRLNGFPTFCKSTGTGIHIIFTPIWIINGDEFWRMLLTWPRQEWKGRRNEAEGRWYAFIRNMEIHKR